MDYKVSVIIPFHRLENMAYLLACLKSLENQNCSLEIIIVTDKEIPLELQSPNKVIENKSKRTYAEKVNEGVRHATGTHLLIGQDDLIFSKDCIKTMLEEINMASCMMNPMSNCDLENQFFTKFSFSDETGKTHIELRKSHKLEEIKPFLPTLMQKISFAPVWQKTSFLNTYCTLMTRKTWDDLGGYDENFRNGKEDIDLSLRANRLNIPMFINWNCFVLHFSGVTAEHHDLSEDNRHSNDYFETKYGNQSLFVFENKKPLT